MGDMSPEDRLAFLREAKAKRDQAAKADSEARELQTLELEEKFTQELGPRGQAFDIVETPEGPIVIKLGEAVLFKRIRDSKGDPTSEDIQLFVTPCVVYPDKKAFAVQVEKRFGVLTRCSDALIALYRGDEAATRGK